LRLEEHLIAVDSDVKKLVLIVAEQAKKVSSGFACRYGSCESKNVYGEIQLEMDKWADDVFTEAFKESGIVRNIASEEQGEITEILKSQGSWGITIDPLDGSSCIKTNLAVGTIVGMFNEGNVMEAGKMMDAACLVIYGPLTTLIYAYKGTGAHEFVLDPAKGEFFLRNESIKIPDGKIYSPGGLSSQWLPEHSRYVAELERQGYKLRYSGSLAADFNQILHYGGIFMYPALQGRSDGKLRLLFEANPLTFIAKEAGGEGSDGINPIHEIVPEKLAQRVPFYIGSKKAVDLANKILGGKNNE
jgi:fructose-1,6-bisphosphatase I